MIRIWRGMWYSDKYGHHPGWPMLLIFTAASGLSVGVTGIVISLVFVGIPFLIGCWDRGDV